MGELPTGRHHPQDLAAETSVQGSTITGSMSSTAEKAPHQTLLARMVA